jgi:hypothetical protein
MIGPKVFSKIEKEKIATDVRVLEEMVISELNDQLLRLCKKMDDYTAMAAGKVHGLIKQAGLSGMVNVYTDDREVSHFNDNLKFKKLECDFQWVDNASIGNIPSDKLASLERVYYAIEEYSADMQGFLCYLGELNDKEEEAYVEYLRFTMVSPLGGDASGLDDRAVLYVIDSPDLYRAEANLCPIPNEDILAEPKFLMKYKPGRLSMRRIRKKASKEDALVYLVSHPDPKLSANTLVEHVAEKMRTASLKEMEENGELMDFPVEERRYPFDNPDYAVSDSSGHVVGVNLNGNVSFEMQQELLRRSSPECEEERDKLLQ